MIRLPCLAACLLVLGGCLEPVPYRETAGDGTVTVEGTTRGRDQVGTWTYRWDDGSVRARGAWEDDEQEGFWRGWHPNGKRHYEGAYDAGRRDGIWRYFHVDGTPQSVGAFDRELQDGPWRFFDEEGRPRTAGSFADGRRELCWVWHEDGELREAGCYYDGIEVGPWVRWEDGEHRVTDRGAPAGFSVLASDGEGSLPWTWRMADGRGNMLEVGWYPGGRPREVASHCDGTFRVQAWHRDGDLVAGGEIVDGKPTGLCLAWDADGRPIRGEDHRGTEVVRWRWNDAGEAVLGPPSTHDPLAPLPPTADADPLDLLVKISRRRAGAGAALVRKEAPTTERELPEPEEISERAETAPVHHAPGFWTRDEERRLPAIERLYSVKEDDEYDRYSRAKTFPSNRGDLVGAPLPQRRMLDADGNVLDLDDLGDGRRVLVVVLRGFAGQVCIYCATQTTVLSERLEEFRERDTEIVFVYPGPASSVPRFLDAVRSIGGDPEAIPRICLDLDFALTRELAIEADLAKPTSILIDRDGEVCYAYEGANLVDRPSAEHLLERIDDLGDAR